MDIAETESKTTHSAPLSDGSRGWPCSMVLLGQGKHIFLGYNIFLSSSCLLDISLYLGIVKKKIVIPVFQCDSP